MPDIKIYIMPSFQPDFSRGAFMDAPAVTPESQERARVLCETVFKDVTFAGAAHFGWDCSIETITLLRPEQAPETLRSIQALGPHTQDDWEHMSFDPADADTWNKRKTYMLKSAELFRIQLNARVLIQLRPGMNALVISHENLIAATIAYQEGARIENGLHWPPRQTLNQGDVVVVTYVNGSGYDPRIEIVRFPKA